MIARRKICLLDTAVLLQEELIVVSRECTKPVETQVRPITSMESGVRHEAIVPMSLPGDRETAFSQSVDPGSRQFSSVSHTFKSIWAAQISLK